MLKFGPEMLAWPWPKLGYLLAITLLLKGSITFDQAIALVLLALFADSKDRRGRRGK